MFDNISNAFYMTLFCALAPFSLGTMGLVIWWFIYSDSDQQQASRVDDIWAKRDSWGEAVCRQIIAGTLQPNMTPEMVTLAWGEPERIAQPNPQAEQWVYATSADNQPHHYVIFEQGLVTEYVGQGKLHTEGWFNSQNVLIVLGLLTLLIMGLIGLIMGYYSLS